MVFHLPNSPFASASVLNSKQDFLVTRTEGFLVQYHGRQTIYPILINSAKQEQYKFILQKYGYRVGWLGHWIGGTVLRGYKETDVTPVERMTLQNSASLATEKAKILEKRNALETPLPFVAAAFLHIPSKRTDGYYRIKILSENGKKVGHSPSFRLFSKNGGSTVRGASPKQTGLEMIYKSGTAAAWAATYAAMPFWSLGQYLPGGMGRYAAKKVFKWSGAKDSSEHLAEEYDLNGKWSRGKAKLQQMDESVDFEAYGVRRERDIALDEAMGKGGVVVYA